MENQLTQFDQLRAEVTLFVEPCTKLTVGSDQDAETVLSAGKAVKDFMKKIEARRTELVKPLNERVKEINAYAKQIGAPLEAAESHIKKQLVSWERVLEQKRQEEMRKLEAARKQAEAEAQAKLKAQQEEAETVAMFMEEKEVKRTEIIQQAEAERAIFAIEKDHKEAEKTVAAIKVSGARKTWTFEVTDEALIPRAYLCIDEKAIRQAVRDGIREIPGVNIFQETSIAI